MKRRKPKSSTALLCAASAATVAASGLFVALASKAEPVAAVILPRRTRPSKAEPVAAVILPRRTLRIAPAVETPRLNDHVQRQFFNWWRALDVPRALSMVNSATTLFYSTVQQSVMFKASSRSQYMVTCLNRAMCDALAKTLIILQGIRNIGAEQIPCGRFVGDLMNLLQRSGASQLAPMVNFNFNQAIIFMIGSLNIAMAYILNSDNIKQRLQRHISHEYLIICQLVLVPLVLCIFRSSLLSRKNICSTLILGFLITGIAAVGVPRITEMKPTQQPICIADNRSLYARQHICVPEDFESAFNAFADFETPQLKDDSLFTETQNGKQTDTMLQLVGEIITSAPQKIKLLLADFVKVDAAKRTVTIDRAFSLRLLRMVENPKNTNLLGFNKALSNVVGASGGVGDISINVLSERERALEKMFKPGGEMVTWLQSSDLPDASGVCFLSTVLLVIRSSMLAL